MLARMPAWAGMACFAGLTAVWLAGFEGDAGDDAISPWVVPGVLVSALAVVAAGFVVGRWRGLLLGALPGGAALAVGGLSLVAPLGETRAWVSLGIVLATAGWAWLFAPLLAAGVLLRERLDGSDGGA